MVNVEPYDARISSRLLCSLGMSMITLEYVPRSVSRFSGITVARMPDYHNSCSVNFIPRESVHQTYETVEDTCRQEPVTIKPLFILLTRLWLDHCKTIY